MKKKRRILLRTMRVLSSTLQSHQKDNKERKRMRFHRTQKYYESQSMTLFQELHKSWKKTIQNSQQKRWNYTIRKKNGRRNGAHRCTQTEEHQMRKSEEKEILGWIDRRCNKNYLCGSSFKQTSQDSCRFYETSLQMVFKQRHYYQETSLRQWTWIYDAS